MRSTLYRCGKYKQVRIYLFLQDERKLCSDIYKANKYYVILNIECGMHVKTSFLFWFDILITIYFSINGIFHLFLIAEILKLVMWKYPVGNSSL